MTVCIAALCDHEKGAVLVSDRMVTAHFPIGYEFEHQEDTKIVAMDDEKTVHVMVAGDILCGHEIVKLVKGQLAQDERVVSSPEVAEMVRAAYQQVRLTKIIHREIEPRGLNLQGYYTSQQHLSPQIVQMIDQAMHDVDLRVEMLIVGSNGENKTIHTVTNPGAITDHTPIGYGAIGSGAPHATYSLIEASYNTSLARAEVVKLLENAKQRSEVAPGGWQRNDNGSNSC